MTIPRLSFAILVSCFLPAVSLCAADGDEILGLWLMDNGKDRAHIEITRQGDEYEGRILWLERTRYPPDDPMGMGGQPRMDRKNPNPSLRHRPIVGLKILEGLRYAGGARWTGGRVYAPDEGKSYRGKAWLEEDSLKLRGYIGFSLFGRTMEWKRLESAAQGNQDGKALSQSPVSERPR